MPGGQGKKWKAKGHVVSEQHMRDEEEVEEYEMSDGTPGDDQEWSHSSHGSQHADRGTLAAQPDPWELWNQDPWRRQAADNWHRDWKWHDAVGWHRPWDDARAPAGGHWHVARVEETTQAEDGRWHGNSWRGVAGDYGSSTKSETTSDLKGMRPTEKMTVPEFDGEGSEQELGRSARSYVRRVHAWLRCTRMAECERALALYTHLTGRAWIAAEELSVDFLHGEGGIDRLLFELD